MGVEGKSTNTGEWVIDLEIAMVKAFGWSLRDMDETDIESLLPFVFRFTETETETGGNGSKPAQVKRVYCDQVSWL